MLVPVAHTVARPGNRHDGPDKKYFGNNINFILLLFIYSIIILIKETLLFCCSVL